jgi:hypothetical protein
MGFSSVTEGASSDVDQTAGSASVTEGVGLRV